MWMRKEGMRLRCPASHPLGAADAEEAETMDQHAAGEFAEQEAANPSRPIQTTHA